MSEWFIGCIFCGIERASAKHEKCIEDVKEGLVTGFEEQTHLWTELRRVSWPFYGKSVVDIVDKSVNS